MCVFADDLIQSECVVVSGGQMYSMGRSGQPYVRGSVRGMGRAGRGLPHYVRSPGGHRGTVLYLCVCVCVHVLEFTK